MGNPDMGLFPVDSITINRIEPPECDGLGKFPDPDIAPSDGRACAW
jgi:hypothetical protein